MLTDASDPRLRATDGSASLIVITLDETTDMATIKDDVAQVRKTLDDAVPGRDREGRRPAGRDDATRTTRPRRTW